MTTPKTRSFVCSISVLACAACRAPAPATEAPRSKAARASEPEIETETFVDARTQAELETQFSLALTAFDRGAYDRAAELFVQTLLKVPREPSGDELRHLLVQHIAWSLIGSYDMSGDATKLDEGEAMLERYIVKHEQLLPLAHGDREVIYALLGEYASRRAGENPRYVRDELVALTEATSRNLRRGQSGARGHGSTMVRLTEKRTTKIAAKKNPIRLRKVMS